MLRTGFWTAPRRQHQSVEDKFLLAYFLTCPERSSIGLFPIHIGEAAGRTGGDKHQFVTVMERLAEQGEITVDGYWILVRSWWDHNNKPGPGLRQTILRTLDEAPASLRSEWEAIATSAGVFPFVWKDDTTGGRGGTPGGTPGSTSGSAPPPSRPGRAGRTGGRAGRATPGGAGGGTRGNYNNNGNSNSNVKNKTTTDDASVVGSAKLDECDAEASVPPTAEAVPFPERDAEQYRPAFDRVCAQLKVTTLEARDLALELCARVEAARSHPRFQIQQHEPWMRRVVQEARSSGAPILRAGLMYSKRADDDARRVAAVSAAELAAREHQDRDAAAREHVAATLQELDEEALRALADAACGSLNRTANLARKEELRAAVVARRLPTGLGLVALTRAMRSLPLAASAETNR
jgi:hypothetical protein